ncbi:MULTISPECIES: ABC transporter permease [Streptomyces]|uniref:ABC transporter permease n=1 Tax=Streptomyces TaxID=1883 RepID=UPI00140870B0|nr:MULTISPECIES: ABC transporter permease [Streptomyces]MDH6228599.1 ABC-2 type transport system permease protein [Streptomyces sp. MJP52]
MSVAPVIHSEWIKIRSVRASWGSLLAVLVVTVAVTALVFATVGEAEAEDGGDLVKGAFYPLNFAQAAAIAYGATAVSPEYREGALRVSLAAVPRRGLLYWSKAAVITLTALLVALPTTLATFLVGQSLVGEHAIGLDHPGVLRSLVGGALYLVLMTLLAAGLTFLLRSAVGTLSLLIPFVLVGSFVIGDAAGGIGVWLPDQAGNHFFREAATGRLGPWASLAVTAAWAAVALGAGWWAVRRRDA